MTDRVPHYRTAPPSPRPTIIRDLFPLLVLVLLLVLETKQNETNTQAGKPHANVRSSTSTVMLSTSTVMLSTSTVMLSTSTAMLSTSTV